MTHVHTLMYIQETVNNSIVEESGYVQYYAKSSYYTHSYITYSCVGVKCSLYKSAIQLPYPASGPAIEQPTLDYFLASGTPVRKCFQRFPFAFDVLAAWVVSAEVLERRGNLSCGMS